MKNGERLSLEQVRAFLKASEEFRFEASKRKEVYDWVTRTLVRVRCDATTVMSGHPGDPRLCD